MLTKPFAGWTDIIIDIEQVKNLNLSDDKDFFRCSYLTDVPMDLLNQFINCLETKQEVKIEFDAEGWEHSLIVNHMNSKQIIFYEKNIEINSEKNIFDLSKELIFDIESYFEDWIIWTPEIEFDEKEEIEKRKTEIIELLNKLKELTN